MYFGASAAICDKNSKAVAVNAVALTTFIPFSKMSAVVPFHLIAILQVFAVVVNKVVNTPATYLLTLNLATEPCPLIEKELVVPVEESPINRLTELKSRDIATLFLNSINHVPPAEVIIPLENTFDSVNESALRVTEVVVVGIYEVA